MHELSLMDIFRKEKLFFSESLLDAFEDYAMSHSRPKRATIKQVIDTKKCCRSS